MNLLASALLTVGGIVSLGGLVGLWYARKDYQRGEQEMGQPYFIFFNMLKQAGKICGLTLLSSAELTASLLLIAIGITLIAIALLIVH